MCQLCEVKEETLENDSNEWSTMFHKWESFFNGPTEPHIIVNVMKESEAWPIVNLFINSAQEISGPQKSFANYEIEPCSVSLILTTTKVYLGENEADLSDFFLLPLLQRPQKAT